VSEVDPDPYEPDGGSQLGGQDAPDAGDPTDGGKHGRIGAAPSVVADEADPAGSGYAVGGGRVGEEPDAVPVADPGPDA
jgi:hypothetical protein